MMFQEPFGGLITGARGAVLSLLLRTGARPTGRKLHSLLEGEFSLWSVQQALKGLVELGVVDRAVVGSSSVYSINEEHMAIPPLRLLIDPLASLTRVIAEATDDVAVDAVVLFGSTAAGESNAASDIDLAIIGSDPIDPGRLAECVHAATGNACDVLLFSPEEFDEARRRGEPVVADIIRDGVPLIGAIPRHGAKAG